MSLRRGYCNISQKIHQSGVKIRKKLRIQKMRQRQAEADSTRPQISQTAAICHFRTHSTTLSDALARWLKLHLNLSLGSCPPHRGLSTPFGSGDDRWATASFPRACSVRTVTVSLVPSPPTSKDNAMHQSSSQIFPSGLEDLSPS